MKKRILKKKFHNSNRFCPISGENSYPKVSFFAADRGSGSESIILKVEEGELSDIIVELSNFNFHDTEPILLFEKKILYVPKKLSYVEDDLDEIIGKTILDILKYGMR
jgi:hypothetical protein